ncbi:MAG: CopG family transcriptional regulator [Caldilineaceae bacterium]
MAIAKKPIRNHNAIVAPHKEKAAEAFINAAGKATVTTTAVAKKPIIMRFDTEVLKRVDSAARRRGISRSAWIQFTVSRALDQGEG